METEPPRRSTAQVIAVVVVFAGALLLVTSLAFMSGLILVHPPREARGLLPFLAMAFLGALLLFLGRKLRAWGRSDRD